MFKYFIFFLYATAPLAIAAPPPRIVPPHLQNEFTANGVIKISNYLYRNESNLEPPIYFPEWIDQNLVKIEHKECNYYGLTDHYLYQAIEKYLSAIEDKEVAIIGSVTPWYESIVIYYGGKPTSIDYNPIINKDPRIKTMTVKEYEEHPIVFDAIISISSFEHDGLGRYGDPINPHGDFEAMEKTKKMLKKEGLLFLAVPIGQDMLCWNVHRIYGRYRLPLLLKGWKTVDSFGFNEKDYKRFSLQGQHQPVFVLKAE